MAVHDRYLRRVPSELLFPDPDEAEERLSRIERAIADAEVDPDDPLQVGAHPSVAELLADVRPPGDDPQATHAYAFLLFFTYHMWRSGTDPWLIGERAVRQIVTPDVDLEGWTGDLPVGCGYLQLPSNLFFIRPDAEGPAEPVDGLYWHASTGGDFWLLLAAGVRDSRAGFSAVVLDRLPAADARAWAHGKIREDGPDFESSLPGGDLDRLYSMETAGEALKLLTRVLAYVRGHPDALGERETAPEDAERPAGSRYGFRRVSWSDSEGPGPPEATTKGGDAPPADSATTD